MDIGPSSVKVVQLVKKGNTGLSLVALGENSLSSPGIQGKSEEHWVATATAIRKLLDDLKIKTKNAVFGLMEHEAVSRLKWFPPMKEGEIKAALEFEAETFIPHPLDKVEMDYQIVDKDNEGRVLVFIVATLKEVVAKYAKVAKLAKLSLVALETPSVSLSRVFATGDNPVLMVDIGSQFSNLIIGREGNVFLSRTVPIGSDSFSRSVSVSLGIDENVAESYCHAYGLSETELEGKVRKVMMPLFEKLLSEIKKTIYSFKEEWKEDLKVLILVGGGAMIPGFSEEMTKTLGLEIQIAQPFANVAVNFTPTVDVKKEGVKFSTAFGLASRGLM